MDKRKLTTEEVKLFFSIVNKATTAQLYAFIEHLQDEMRERQHKALRLTCEIKHKVMNE